MIIIKEDLLNIKEGLIAHQVNCMGAFKSGVAGAIRERYPLVYREYMKLCRASIDQGDTKSLLGTIQVVPINENLKIINCFSQYNYGYDGQKYTIDEAVESCFKRIALINYKKRPLYVPFKYGCGLGRGDWTVISEIINTHCPDVTACSIE